MDWSILINAFTCAFTLAIVIVSAVTAKRAVRSSQELCKQQMKISVFMGCTSRFQEIKLHLKKEEQNEYYQKLYIDLCSEEFYLNSKDYISNDVWDIWVKGMKVTFEDDPSYNKIWKEDRRYYDENFRQFFDHIMMEHTK